MSNFAGNEFEDENDDSVFQGLFSESLEEYTSLMIPGEEAELQQLLDHDRSIREQELQ